MDQEKSKTSFPPLKPLPKATKGLKQEKTRVLIVEDEQDISTLTVKRLRSLHFEMKSLSQGSHLLETVKEFRPDLVLLDLWLPDVSGIELFRQLKSREEEKKIPVVFFSANPMKEEYCLNELGAEGFIKKPYEASELVEIIKKLT